MSKQKQDNSEARYVGTNWDPDVTMRVHAGQRNPVRKVKTLGKKTIKADWLLERVEEYLRQGYDVWLGEGVRFFPCIDKDLKTMYVAVQAAGDFRNALRDKKFTIRHCGKEIDADEAKDLAMEHYKHASKPEVTPDNMATCPKCGYEFRVGRKIGN